MNTWKKGTQRIVQCQFSWYMGFLHPKIHGARWAIISQEEPIYWRSICLVMVEQQEKKKKIAA